MGIPQVLTSILSNPTAQHNWTSTRRIFLGFFCSWLWGVDAFNREKLDDFCSAVGQNRIRLPAFIFGRCARKQTRSDSFWTNVLRLKDGTNEMRRADHPISTRLNYTISAKFKNKKKKKQWTRHHDQRNSFHLKLHRGIFFLLPSMEHVM